MRGTLGLVWRNRKKISQMINAYLYIPFLIILWIWTTDSDLEAYTKTRKNFQELDAQFWRAGSFAWSFNVYHNGLERNIQHFYIKKFDLFCKDSTQEAFYTYLLPI